MGKRTSYEPGTFSYVELLTTDAAAAKGFYTELLGWEYGEGPMPGGGSYWLAQVGGETVAGLMDQPAAQRDAGVPPAWFSYITVADADETAGRVRELGGDVHAEPFDVMGLGRMAVIADPTGAMFAAWQAGDRIGATQVNDPGCLTWNELSTSDPTAARAFYAKLFGWRFEQMDTAGGPAYWLIEHEGAAEGRNGGMRELAPEQAQMDVPSHWMPYFTVEAAADAVTRGSGAGASTHAGPMEVPAGTIAVLSDPQGAFFGIFEGEVDP